MHLTIERKRLVKMLESVRRKLPGQKKKDKEVRLFACAARVFVEANGVTAGEEALVLRDGGCRQPLEQFLALVKSYADKEHVTIEADERALRMFTSTRSVSGFTSDVKPPADFVVGRVTDLWVSGSNQCSPMPPATRRKPTMTP
jgi:hypothetical protein